MLPTHKTPRKQQLCDLTVLIHGPQKFGKSSLCAEAEGALFLATEPGLNSLEVFQQPIRTWDDLLCAAKEIADGKHPFRTIVLDTVDNAYRMCAEYICLRKGVEHESDLEYGKGYALVNGEFYRVLNKLALLPYGLFLISHSQDKEIETRTGKYTKVVPTLPEKASKFALGLVDVILFCDFEVITGPDGKPVHRRVLRTKPSTAYEAGDRTRRLPEVLDCSYAAFAAAFEATPSTPAAPAHEAEAPPVRPAAEPAANGSTPPLTRDAVRASTPPTTTATGAAKPRSNPVPNR
ncbi:MAG TPA: ATP-binding protein [Kofleriaceae bacterium]|nr:ATP-binding protein [Kofleriaceae bacterium]